MNNPKNANELMTIVNKNIDVYIDRSSPIQDKPATKKMIEKNMRYIAKHKGLDKIWATPEGQESICHAFNESLEHAATMPEMGSIVPFGSSAEFVPSVECYTFMLATGKNPPFEDINIVLVHKNDKTLVTQDEGIFNVKIDYGIPRGEIIAVCVYATRKDTGKRIGDIYDVDRLMGKALKHSPGYRSYMLDKEDFKRLEVEGKLKKDQSGREYMEKTMFKKGGGTWIKKIYAHDIQNPYEGADRPEMLKKSAGKTFFRPYMKTRNASEMADEWSEEDNSTMEKAADNVLNKASEQFETTPAPYNKEIVDNIIDAEIVDIVVGKEEKKDDDINNL